jgi:RNA polymerase sigma-70 factor (ECF subfamily)
MRRRLPNRRLDWNLATQPNEEELAILRRFMDAYEQSDAGALAALLCDDARQTMPPIPTWYDGRDAIVAQKAWWLGAGSIGELRGVPTAANRQPAAAFYLRRHDDSEYRLICVDVLRIQDGQIAEISSFLEPLIAAFDLPPTL